MVRKIKKRVTKKQKTTGMIMPKMAESGVDENDFEKCTGQHSLEYWYGGFAVERSPATEIEFWERVADEYEKRIEKFPVRPRDSVFKNVMADALKGTPLGVMGLAASDESKEPGGLA